MTFLRTSAPALAWSTTGAIEGDGQRPGREHGWPDGFDGALPDGVERRRGRSASCRAGDYTYTVTVVGENGDERSASATLTIA